MKGMNNLFKVMLFACLSSSIVNAQDLDNGLVAKFLFNGNLADSSGNGNDLEANYSYKLVEDRFGNSGSAMEIPDEADGTKYFVTESSSALYDFSTEFSISYWIRYSSSLPSGYILYGGKANETEIEFALKTSSGYLEYGDNTFWDIPLQSESFIHVVVIYKNGVLSGYINGVKSFFEFNISYQNVNTGSLVIGKYSESDASAYGYVGYYDDIYMYNRALSETEILLLYGDSPVGVSSVKSTETNVFPNPIDSIVKISGDVKVVKIYTTQGKLVVKERNTNTIDLSTLTSGVYVLKVKTKSGVVETHQVIKK